MKIKKTGNKIICEYDSVEDIITLTRLSLQFSINIYDKKHGILLKSITFGEKINAGLYTELTMYDGINETTENYTREEVIDIVFDYLSITGVNIVVEILQKDFYQYETLLGLLPSVSKDFINSCLLIEKKSNMYRLSIKDGKSISEIYYWDIKPYPLFVFKPEEYKINFTSSITSIEDLLT